MRERANKYFLFTITRVAREIREIIFILQTVENVSSLETSSYSINVITIPFSYVDENIDATETLIASVSIVKPSETVSNLHVESNVETHVEPHVEASVKTVSKSISQDNPIFKETLENSTFVTVVVDGIDSEPPTKETSPEPSTDQMNLPTGRVKEFVIDIPAEPCVVSVSQVDFVSNEAVELSSTHDSFTVFVSDSVTNVEPDVGACVLKDNGVESSSENVVDLFEHSENLILKWLRTKILRIQRLITKCA